MVQFLKGEDYPWICEACQRVLDQVLALYKEDMLPDTDNEEAPCDYMYDHEMFCGGAVCANKPAKT